MSIPYMSLFQRHTEYLLAIYVVGLDELHAPSGVEADDGIVVRLSSGAGHVDTVHVVVPAAHGVLVGDIGGMDRGAFHRGGGRYGLPGNASHDMEDRKRTRLNS